MQTHSLIAMVGAVAIVASSVALFAHSMRPPAYDITLAPDVINGLPVDNLAPVEVTANVMPARRSHALPGELSDSISARGRTHASISLQAAMPYYSFAHPLASSKKD